VIVNENGTLETWLAGAGSAVHQRSGLKGSFGRVCKCECIAITINQQVFCEPRYKLTAYLHCKGCVILLWQYPLIFPINSIVSLSLLLLELVLGFNSVEERQAFDLAPDVGLSLESPHVRLCMNNVDCPTYSPGFQV
jgi:hypothetical protein